MGRRSGGGGNKGDVALEAARIFVEDALTDYGVAKRKAAERLGLSPRAGLPDNAQVQAEIIAYQRLFGGRAYTERLSALRRTAVEVMKLLAPFEPRLCGAVVSGAISEASRIQLHAFPAKPELVDVFLGERRIEMQADERDYRWPDGHVEAIPLARFQANAVGVDIALFPEGSERRMPLSSTDGRPVKRLKLAEAEALLAAGIETI